MKNKLSHTEPPGSSHAWSSFYPTSFLCLSQYIPFLKSLVTERDLRKQVWNQATRTFELLCRWWASKIPAGWLWDNGKSSLGGRGLEAICAGEAWTADKWEGVFQICNFQVSEGCCAAPLTLGILGRFSLFPSTHLLCEVQPLHSHDPEPTTENENSRC